MQNKNFSRFDILFGLIVLIALSGCVKMGASMLIGGEYVEEYEPDKILVTYEPQGAFPEGSTFHLIETETGLAFFQQDIDGSGMICEKFWYEGDSVYFSAAFFGYGPAFIYKVPVDRTLNAERYVYENGTYQGTPGDRLRPMPNAPKVKPDTILIPINIFDMGSVRLETSQENGSDSVSSDGHDKTPSAKIQKLENQLSSSDSAIKRDAAIKLYRSGDFRDPYLLEIVNLELIKGYNQNLNDGVHIDAMAWLCRILGASGNELYYKSLEEVMQSSESRKIRRYAKKSLGTHK